MAFDAIFHAAWLVSGRNKVPNLEPLFVVLRQMVVRPAEFDWTKTWERPPSEPIPLIPMYGMPGTGPKYKDIATYTFVEAADAHWQLDIVVEGGGHNATRRRFVLARSVDGQKSPYVPRLHVTAEWRGDNVLVEPVEITIYASSRNAPTTQVRWSGDTGNIKIVVPTERSFEVDAAVKPVIGDCRYATPEELTRTYIVAILPRNMQTAAGYSL